MIFPQEAYTFNEKIQTQAQWQFEEKHLQFFKRGRETMMLLNIEQTLIFFP